MTPAVQNERTKLFANALDRASTACIAVGILAPVATLLSGAGVPNPRAIPLLGSFSAWTLTALSLHLLARRVLLRLVP
jgi:hypothetical protein